MVYILFLYNVYHIMGHPDIEKCRSELVSYVRDNMDDYRQIFRLYDSKNCSSIERDFRDFCLKIKTCKDFSEKKIVLLINLHKDLFYKIGKSSKLSKHHKVCVMSINVYLSFLSNYSKNSKPNVCKIDEKYESTRDNTSSTSEQSCAFKDCGSVCKIGSKSSSCSKSCSSSSNEINCNKPCDTKSHDSKSCDYKPPKEDNCEPCKDVCDTDDDYPFKDGYENGCCNQGIPNDDVCGFGDYDDLDQLQKVTLRLKNVLKQICMLVSILCEMQKEFVSKMNTFGVCDSDMYINCIDIDYENKLMFVLYKQIDSLITQSNCVFNGTKDTAPIKVYLNCGKSFTVCIIDNVKFTLVQDCKKKFILVNIGTRQYKLWFLGDCMTNAAAICLLKQNCCTIKLILNALHSNKKMIEHWTNVAKNMEKFKDYCDDKKDCCNSRTKYMC
jgi:hypothetical protein